MAETKAALSVAQLAALIKRTLTGGLPGKLRVAGQVSNFSGKRGAASSHWFFSLKDEEACVRCVMFATSARKVAFPVADGLEVVATGRVDFYDAQGNVQLYVDALEPVGAGALELAFRALCEELRRAGYFDPARKRPLPLLPRMVAVVTSRDAAALQDVIHTAARRWRGCRLVLVDVRVQGADAAPQVAAALDALSRDGARHGIDAVILTRGGGSMEDLWAFNERAVADAVFRCTLPVVAAIGHETDTTVAELVADVRCATPTQAAMTLIPDAAALRHQLDQYRGRLVTLVRRDLAQRRQHVEGLARQPMFRDPGRAFEPARQRRAHLAQRLRGAAAGRVERARQRVDSTARHLEAVSPQRVLERGYSVTFTADGGVVRDAADVRDGAKLVTRLAKGSVRSVAGDGGPVVGAAALRVMKRRKKVEGEAPSLFPVEGESGS